MLLAHALSYRLKHRETQSGFSFSRCFECRAEIAIAFARDPLLKSTPDGPKGIGGVWSHVKKRDRTCHSVPGSGGVFRLFEQPKSENAPRNHGERTGRA